MEKITPKQTTKSNSMGFACWLNNYFYGVNFQEMYRHQRNRVVGIEDTFSYFEIYVLKELLG